MCVVINNLNTPYRPFYHEIEQKKKPLRTVTKIYSNTNPHNVICFYLLHMVCVEA